MLPRGRVRYAALIAVLAWGCADSHLGAEDGAVDGVDTSVLDGDRADAYDRCTVAGRARCDLACGRDRFYCQRPIAEDDGYCISGVCLSYGELDSWSGCVDDELTCPDSRVCVSDPEWGGGICMPEGFCDQAAAEGYPLPCMWTDRTPRVTGAPRDVGACPAPVHPGTPFCGEPCGGCAPYPNTNRGRFSPQPACIGRSDARQFGICGPATSCRRGMWAGDDVCGPPGDIGFPRIEETSCVCVVFASPDTTDGLSDFGFATSIEGCRAYRDMYPGAIQCVIDRDWHTLP